MTQRTCMSCDNPVRDQITICGRCERDTRKRLGDMEAHRQELELTLTRQAKLQAQSDGGRSANTPLVFDDRASELLAEQRNILVGWCKLIHDEIDGTWPRADTVHAMAMQIESRMTDLHTHEAAFELVDELAELVRQILECIDYPEDRSRTKVGDCPQILTDDTRCPGEVILHQPRMYADCAECGMIWEGQHLNRLGQRMLNRKAYGTVLEISGLYLLPPGTIRRWISEGRLVRMPDETIPLAEVDKLLDTLGRDVA